MDPLVQAAHDYRDAKNAEDQVAANGQVLIDAQTQAAAAHDAANAAVSNHATELANAQTVTAEKLAALEAAAISSP